jgi:hypothetical protein
VCHLNAKFGKFWPKLWLSITAMVATVFVGNPAFAQSQPLKPGTYGCWTLSMSYRAPPAPDSQSEINRRARQLEIDPNSRSIQSPNLSLVPAVFGNVILDGKGRYRIPAVKQTGTYGFDRRKGLPTFTGDLGGMKLVEYSGTGTSFVLGWQDMNYQCGLEGQGRASAAEKAGTKTPNVAFVSWVGPKLSSAKASDFEGRFEGSYMCSSVATRMELDLKPRADGTITAVFRFGGIKTPEVNYSVGSYSMKGTWQGTHFVLKSDQWIVQPNGYVMTDIEGDVTTKGVAGTMLYSSCDSFAAGRVNS